MRRTSVLQVLGFPLPERLRRARHSQDMRIRGNWRNLACKMQTTRFFCIYRDTVFERKWENSINEALNLCWKRSHSGLILPVEILTVSKAAISMVGKVTLSLPACNELSFPQTAWWSWQLRPEQLQKSSMCVAAKLLLLSFVIQCQARTLHLLLPRRLFFLVYSVVQLTDGGIW